MDFRISKFLGSNKDGKMRVWHIPQVPGEPFHVYVKDVYEAVFVLDILAEYDLFQYENNIKPDYSNAAGLEVYDEQDGEWCEWYDEFGDDVEHYCNMHYEMSQDE